MHTLQYSLHWTIVDIFTKLFLLVMAIRAQFENSNEIGVFSLLTNAYALVAIGGSENFYSVFEQELKVYYFRESPKNYFHL